MVTDLIVDYTDCATDLECRAWVLAVNSKLAAGNTTLPTKREFDHALAYLDALPDTSGVTLRRGRGRGDPCPA